MTKRTYDRSSNENATTLAPPTGSGLLQDCCTPFASLSQRRKASTVTIELYRVDPYCVDFGAQVMATGDDFVILDQTYFFAESPDQASDCGFIDSYPITLAIRVDAQIRHVMGGADAHALRAGDIVSCQVDWERRYQTMRLHTAQHLLRIAVRETHDVGPPSRGSVDHVSASIGYSVNRSHRIELPAIQSWLDTAIAEDHLMIHESDHSLQQGRHWHIDGLAALPCDGTHVRFTSEVGSLEIQHLHHSDDTIEFRVGLLPD